MKKSVVLLGLLFVIIVSIISPRKALSETLYGLEESPGLSFNAVTIDLATGASTPIRGVPQIGYQDSTFDPINQIYYVSYRGADSQYYLGTYNTVTNAFSQTPTSTDYGLASIEYAYIPEPASIALFSADQ